MTGHLTFVKTYFERAISPPNIKRFCQTPAWPIETIVRDKKNDLAAIVLPSEREWELPIPCNCLKAMPGATGLEPAASCVTGRRSNQLNYAPALKFPLLIYYRLFLLCPCIPNNHQKCRDRAVGGLGA